MERCNCCGSLIKFRMEDGVLEKIELLIKEDDLNSKSRVQTKTHKRYFLYKLMRDRGYSLQRIGEFFNRNHATILHGVRMHYLFTDSNDSTYLKDTEEYDNLFQINK